MEFSCVSRAAAVAAGTEEDMEVRKGPWTAEEDSLLFDYVTVHGEGRWNAVARCSGLKRTGKSCRLRWLNYLRPDVRRGNISLQEQLMILELHSRWGNRWSKIAQHLPGRTDNEIKNYWRTRVQKQAKQLKCDVNSKQFRDALRYEWIPRLMERIQAQQLDTTTTTTAPVSDDSDQRVKSLVPELSELSDAGVDNNESMSNGMGSDAWLEEESVWKWSEENFWFLQQQLFD